MFDPNDQGILQTHSDPAFHFHSNHPSDANPPLNTLKQYPRPRRKLRSRVLWGCLTFLILVLLCMVGAISLRNSPNYFPPTLAQQISVQAFFFLGFGGILALVLLLRIFWRTPLREPLAWTIGLSFLTLVATVALWGILVHPYVSMTRTNFVRTSVSLNNGETLHLQNPADGVTQTLCIGVDQKCQPENGAPAALNHGIRVLPGQSITIPFDTDGTYHLTSETTPGMNLSIDVSTPDDSGVY